MKKLVHLHSLKLDEKTKMSKKQFRDFKSAREFTRKLGIKNISEWKEYCKSGNKPKNIPAAPDTVYEKQWLRWGDWLGTGSIAPRDRKFRDFESAREFARKLGIKSAKEWRTYCKSDNKPDDITSNPHRTYKNEGWINWGDWLGTGSIASYSKEYQNFESAREFVRNLNLSNVTEWIEYCKSDNKPDDIPSNAHLTYKNKGWKGYGDWLGTGNIAPRDRKFRDFESAREFVRSLNLKGQKEWNDYCKSDNKPDDIPQKPSRTYKNKGWFNWGDWLGTGNMSSKNVSKNFLPFKEAREEARRLAKKFNIKTTSDWQDAIKKGLIPKNIPSNPYHSYKKKRKKDGKRNN